jgi:RNA polymerase sigma-70 factor (sigma-E family)
MRMVGVDASVGAMAQARGDERDEVLSAVFRESYSELVGLAALLLDERGLAEEVVQEAFARTYVAWPRLRERSDPLPYVRRAVMNLARGGLRRRMIARRHRPAVEEVAASPEAMLLAEERSEAIADAVAALPRRQRECVVLRYLLDCSVAETAAALGISDGAVKQHVHRAMTALADVLGVDAEDEV